MSRTILAAIVVVTVVVSSIVFIFREDLFGVGHVQMSKRPSVDELRARVPGYKQLNPWKPREFSSFQSSSLALVSSTLATAESDRVERADERMLSFLSKPEESRSEKIYALLWHERQATDTDSRIYLLDYLAALQPIEVASELIADYRQTDDVNVKIALLRTIAAAFSFDPEGDLPSDFATEWDSIQTFYRDEFARTKDPALLREFLQSALSILPADQAVSIFQTSVDVSALQESDVSDFYIQALIADKDLQGSILNQLHNVYANQAFVGGRDFSDKLVGLVTDDTRGTVFDPEALKQVRELVAQYEPALGADMGASEVGMYYRWLQFMEQTAHPGESSAAIAERLLHTTEALDPIRTAAVIVMLPDETVAGMSPSSANATVARLEQGLSADSLSDSQRQVLRDATAHLRK